MRNRVLDIEGMADQHMGTLAVLNGDVFSGLPVSRRPFNHDPEQGIATAPPEFDIHEH